MRFWYGPFLVRRIVDLFSVGGSSWRAIIAVPDTGWEDFSRTTPAAFGYRREYILDPITKFKKAFVNRSDCVIQRLEKGNVFSGATSHGSQEAWLWIFESPKEVSEGRAKTLLKSCSVVTGPQVQCEMWSLVWCDSGNCLRAVGIQCISGYKHG